jgi:hypothetical protein
MFLCAYLIHIYGDTVSLNFKNTVLFQQIRLLALKASEKRESELAIDL